MIYEAMDTAEKEIEMDSLCLWRPLGRVICSETERERACECVVNVGVWSVMSSVCIPQ